MPPSGRPSPGVCSPRPAHARQDGGGGRAPCPPSPGARLPRAPTASARTPARRGGGVSVSLPHPRARGPRPVPGSPHGTYPQQPRPDGTDTERPPRSGTRATPSLSSGTHGSLQVTSAGISALPGRAAWKMPERENRPRSRTALRLRDAPDGRGGEGRGAECCVRRTFWNTTACAYAAGEPARGRSPPSTAPPLTHARTARATRGPASGAGSKGRVPEPCVWNALP